MGSRWLPVQPLNLPVPVAHFRVESPQPVGQSLHPRNGRKILYETSSYLRLSSTTIGDLAGSSSRLGRQQRHDSVADPGAAIARADDGHAAQDRKSTRLNSSHV